jgi:hypothetical protein
MCRAAERAGCFGDVLIQLRDPPAVASGRSAVGSFARTAFGPMTKGADLAVHELSQWNRVGHRFEDVFGGWFPAFGKCLV